MMKKFAQPRENEGLSGKMGPVFLQPKKVKGQENVLVE